MAAINDFITDMMNVHVLRLNFIKALVKLAPNWDAFETLLPGGAELIIDLYVPRIYLFPHGLIAIISNYVYEYKLSIDDFSFLPIKEKIMAIIALNAPLPLYGPLLTRHFNNDEFVKTITFAEKQVMLTNAIKHDNWFYFQIVYEKNIKYMGADEFIAVLNTCIDLGAIRLLQIFSNEKLMDWAAPHLVLYGLEHNIIDNDIMKWLLKCLKMSNNDSIDIKLMQMALIKDLDFVVHELFMKEKRYKIECDLLEQAETLKAIKCYPIIKRRMEATAIKPDYIYDNQQHQSYTMDDWHADSDNNDGGWNTEDDGDWAVEDDGFVSCFNCNKRSNAMKMCSKCKIALYCNKKCQKKHWKQHKPNCVENDKKKSKKVRNENDEKKKKKSKKTKKNVKIKMECSTKKTMK